MQRILMHIDAKDIDAENINAKDINAWDIDAENINAWDIDAGNIDAENIDAGNIDALNIDAKDIVYFSVCFARETFKCVSVKGMEIEFKIKEKTLEKMDKEELINKIKQLEKKKGV